MSGGRVERCLLDWTYEAIQESRLLLALDAAEEADDGDDAVEGDCFEGLGLRRLLLAIRSLDGILKWEHKTAP
jgi:hypothetical protein